VFRPSTRRLACFATVTLTALTLIAGLGPPTSASTGRASGVPIGRGAGGSAVVPAVEGAAGVGAVPSAGRTASLPGAATPDAKEEGRGFRLSVRGAGPYRIGATLARLTDAGLVDSPAPRAGCDGIIDAGATGRWAGKILLVFRRGVLIRIGTASGSVRSPAGVGPGTSFEEAEKIYGRRGEPIRGRDGQQGYVVRVGAMVELFTDHPIRSGIGWFEVGPRSYSERGFREGSRC